MASSTLDKWVRRTKRKGAEESTSVFVVTLCTYDNDYKRPESYGECVGVAHRYEDACRIAIDHMLREGLWEMSLSSKQASKAIGILTEPISDRPSTRLAKFQKFSLEAWRARDDVHTPGCDVKVEEVEVDQVPLDSSLKEEAKKQVAFWEEYCDEEEEEEEDN